MSTALAYVPALAHSQQFHPENKERVEGLLRFFEKQGVLSELNLVDPRPADAALLARAHSRGLLEEIRQACSRGVSRLDADTYVTPHSYELARLAVGGCCEVVNAVFGGEVRNGLAIVRPPGHHAERESVGGFCLLNNVAIATRHAQRAHKADRVLIVDFDVHHGNGTQDIFYEESDVLFFSLHLFHPFFYPGTGSANEIGERNGQGFTVNVPFPPAVGDGGYSQAMEQLVLPRARLFAPDAIIVSAGFDAHWQDPLARASLSLRGYAHMCRQLIALADELCGGRIIFVLEGGYHVPALQYGLLNLAYALLGRDELHDPLGPVTETERDVSELIRRLQQLHLLI